MKITVGEVTNNKADVREYMSYDEKTERIYVDGDELDTVLIDRSNEWKQRNKYYREFMLSKLADVMEHVDLAKKMSSEVIVRKELNRAMEEMKLTRKGLEGKQ